MNDEERTEAELAKLFADTREEPDGPQLTKLLARAEDIPTQTRRGWVPRWLWVPTLAGAGAVAALMWTGTEGPNADSSEPAVAFAAGPPLKPLASPPSLPAEELALAEEALEELETELGSALNDNALVSTVSAELSDDDSWDLLYGPPFDADLDAWLEATEELLGDGE